VLSPNRTLFVFALSTFDLGESSPLPYERRILSSQTSGKRRATHVVEHLRTNRKQNRPDKDYSDRIDTTEDESGILIT
jgi:hypothetical protein